MDIKVIKTEKEYSQALKRLEVIFDSAVNTLELLVLGEIVPDFPLCNKSVNGSYSGHDL